MRGTRWLRCIGAAASLLLAACAGEGTPPELVGAWATDAPRYRDRGFRITADSLILGVGGGLIDANRLRSIRRVPEPNRIRFEITYANVARRAIDVRLYYYPSDQTVRWASRSDVVWRRAGP